MRVNLLLISAAESVSRGVFVVGAVMSGRSPETLIAALEEAANDNSIRWMARAARSGMKHPSTVTSGMSVAGTIPERMAFGLLLSLSQGYRLSRSKPRRIRIPWRM